jgi:hypothetical protein
MHDEAFVRVVRGQGTRKTKEHVMNQEQFGQFWEQLKTPLKTKWEKFTAQDINEIKGDLATFGLVLHRRYGGLQKPDVTTWANRRYSHWTGNYAGYEDAEAFLALHKEVV